MTRDDAKEYVNRQEPIFLTAARKRGTYICPKCGNGTGTSGDGITQDKKTGRWKCFVCGMNEDIIGLIGATYGLTDNKAIFDKAYEVYRIDIDGHGTESKKADLPKIQTTQTEKTAPAADKEDYTQYYRECAKHLHETEYLKMRGITDELTTRFLIGYDPKKKEIIFPNSKTSYNARYLYGTKEENNRYRKSKGEQHIFNFKALQGAEPVYITEGEIDALSIMAAGGQAAAIGGAANCNKLVNAISQKEINAPLIICLDFDEAGRRNTAALIEQLQPIRYPFIEYHPYTEGDANDALIKNKAILIDKVQEGIENINKVIADIKAAEVEEYKKTLNAGYSLQAFIDNIADGAKCPPVSTGFKTLDKLMDGGLYVGLYTVGAISSLGKTTFCLQIADQIAAGGHDVIVFSLEMDKNELLAKSISRYTYLLTDDCRLSKTTRGILNGTLYAHYTNAEKDLIHKAIDNYSKAAEHLYISVPQSMAGISAYTIRETVQKHIEKTGNKPIVIVDYLQIIEPYFDVTEYARGDNKTINVNVSRSDKQNTDQTVKYLKWVSRDFSIPVIAISSFNRDNYDAPANMQAFKESGSVEYSSDVLLGLQLEGAGTRDFDVDEAKRKTPRQVECCILKQRNGATGKKIKFEYNQLFNCFTESDTQEQPRKVFEL